MSYAKRRALQLEADRRRRVKEPIHKLDAAQRQKLEATPIEDFFNIDFLEGVLGQKHQFCVSLEASVPNILHCIRHKWPDIRTVGDAAKKPLLCESLVDLSGFGGSALTILVDSFAAFGYELNYEAVKPPKQESESERKAKELAKRLGL